MSASAQDMRQRLQRWPLVAQPSNRGISLLQDGRLLNAYAEQDLMTGEWQVQKRPGYALSTTLGAGAQNGRGIYTWATQALPAVPHLYTVVGNGLTASLYLDGSVTGAAGGLTDTGGNWSWTETQPVTGTRYLVFASTTTVYYSPGTGFTAATLPAGRGTNIVGLAYLDGTVYAMDEKCQIWGSNLDDPTTWSSLNVITAKKVPGAGVGLVKQLSYVIALKSASMEVFYDNQNPTGSPLTQIDGATNSFGCSNRDSIQTLDDILFYMSSNGGTSGLTASPKIIRVDNLIPSVVSTPPVERLIDSWQSVGTIYSWVFKHLGHRFYAVSNSSSGGTGLTLVFDIDQKLWYQWTDPSGNWLQIAGVAIDSSYNHVMMPVSGISGLPINFVDGDFKYPTDNGSIIPVDIYTPNTDFGTRRRKTLYRMYIRSDQTPGSILQVRHSDNDYATWSSWRYMDLNRKTPYMDNEGTFTKRAYNFRHARATAFRIRSADLQMELGTI